MSKEHAHVAACGICCGVCGLYQKGICLPCGSGLKKDEETVKKKMEEQMRNLGYVCSKLQCVVKKGTGYCMRDCPEFPREYYEERPFPYSEGFLKMYMSRSKKAIPRLSAADWRYYR
jgi:hypothetical protein